MTPPTSGPNAMLYPTRTHSTLISPRTMNDWTTVPKTFFRRTIPP